MSHTANTAHTEPTTRRAARRGAVEDVVVTEDGLVLNDPTHLELPGHGNSPGAWAMVALVLVGFVAGCVGLLADWSVVVWIGVALMAVGVVVGIVAGKAGAGRGGTDHVPRARSVGGEPDRRAATPGQTPAQARNAQGELER